LWMTVLMCGWKRAMEVLPALIVAGFCFAGTQFYTSNYVSPYLPDITSAVVTIIGLGVFLKYWKPKHIWRFPDEPTATICLDCKYSMTEVLRAWMPYIFLVIMVFLWGLVPVKKILAPLDMAFAWPLLHNLVIKTTPIVAKNTPYAASYALNIFSAGGSAIFFSGLFSLFIIPNYGFSRGLGCFGRTIKQLIYPIFTISVILGLAFVTNYSGMSATIGIALAATGSFFPFFAPILGWLGVFLTGSDTSSNALFGALQKTTAEQIGVDPTLTVAANSSGGVCGKMISPQSISVATAATGMVGQEGSLFRFTVLHSLAMLLFIALLTYAQAYALSWMLP